MSLSPCCDWLIFHTRFYQPITEQEAGFVGITGGGAESLLGASSVPRQVTETGGGLGSGAEAEEL